MGDLKVCPTNAGNTTVFANCNRNQLGIIQSYMFLTLIYLNIWFGCLLLFRCLKSVKKTIEEGMEPPEITVYHCTYKKRAKSCGPVVHRTELKKPTEHLSADDLQKIAGVDDTIEQETVTEYCYGGYKPIEIGEELVHRYSVVRKLGFGHFSTVWLCKDKKKTNNINYVAVKVVKAADMFTCVAQDEIKLLRCVMTKDPEHEGRNHVIQMLDFFEVRSINGFHTCISFELMGPSLLQLLVQSDYRGIHLPGVRNILTQILKGIIYLHDVCHIIHTDLKPENILIKVNDAYVRHLVETSTRYNELGVQMPRTYVSSETWENYLYYRDPVNYDTAGPSTKEKPPVKPKRPNSFPKDEIKVRTPPEHHDSPNKLKLPMYISPHIEVKIADLGNACWENRHFSTNIQTRQYRALEVILGAGYSYPADMWSIGCIAYELATAEYLFNPKRNQYLTSSEDHILLIMELLGGIPKYIAQRGSNAHNFFDGTGNLKIYSDQIRLRFWKTEDVLVEKYKWKRVDAIPFAAMLESMIEPDPELRINAASALKCDWLNEA